MMRPSNTHWQCDCNKFNIVPNEIDECEKCGADSEDHPYAAESQMEKYQEELFRKVKNFSISCLAGYIQTSFRKLIDDGIADRNGIKENNAGLEAGFNNAFNELKNLEIRMICLMNHYARKAKR